MFPTSDQMTRLVRFDTSGHIFDDPNHSTRRSCHNLLLQLTLADDEDFLVDWQQPPGHDPLPG